MLEFDSYYKIRNTYFKEENSCIEILKEILPFLNKKNVIKHPLCLIESIIEYVRCSGLENAKIDNEIDYFLEFLNSPFNMAGTIIYFTDHSGRLITANKHFYNIYNNSNNKFISKTLYSKESVYLSDLIVSDNKLYSWPILGNDGTYCGSISTLKLIH